MPLAIEPAEEVEERLKISTPGSSEVKMTVQVRLACTIVVQPSYSLYKAKA